MKHMIAFGVAGWLVMPFSALAAGQDVPQTPPRTPPQTRPQTSPPQTRPQQDMPPRQKQTMPQKMRQDMPMRKHAPDKAKQEVATAHAHALMAQGAQSVDMVHTHLHHVINCLEGPQGTDFDARAANPCKGKGQGALPDSMGNADLQSRLRQAVDAARAGIGADDLQQAQQHATEAASLLQAKPADDGMMHHQ